MRKKSFASRRVAREGGRSVGRSSETSGGQGGGWVGGRGAELAGWPTGSGAGARFARARFSNPTLTPTLTRPVKASTEVVAQRATLTLTQLTTRRKDAPRLSPIAMLVIDMMEPSACKVPTTSK